MGNRLDDEIIRLCNRVEQLEAASATWRKGYEKVDQEATGLAMRIAQLEAALQEIAMYGDPDIPYGDTWQRYFEQVRETARKALGLQS